MFEILQFPFMQRALIAGVVLSIVLAYLGIFVILRKMAFFSDGVAHASLAGVAVGILTGVSPLGVALVIGVVMAILIYWLEKKTILSADAIIGILFTAGMALGVILMSLKSGYQPELISFLFGNILAIKTSELLVIVLLSFAIMIFLTTQRKKLTLLSFDSEIAYVSGVNPNLYQLALYIVLALAVVLGIKILGIILVSALLIVPVSTAKLFAGSFRSLVAFTLLISEVVVLTGLFLSYYFNFPTGATIVLTGTATFSIVFVATALKNVLRARA